jgi:hypothetical protein
MTPNIVPVLIADCTVTYIGLLSFTSEHVGSVGLVAGIPGFLIPDVPFFGISTCLAGWNR